MNDSRSAVCRLALFKGEGRVRVEYLRGAAKPLTSVLSTCEGERWMSSGEAVSQ